MSDETTRHHSILGTWAGTSSLWLEPGTPVRESASILTARALARGEFMIVEYTWSFEDRPQAGALMLGWDPKQARWQAAWVDSWHMGSVMMPCVGTDAERVDVRGEYEVGGGNPNWGWRIALEVEDEGLWLRMWNIAPDGTEYPAVEARYTKDGGEQLADLPPAPA